MNYDVPVFNPFVNPDDESYYPSNKDAQMLLHIQYAYEDIFSLFKLIKKLGAGHHSRLLYKYAVVEWLSLDKPLCSLVSRVLKGKVDYDLDPAELDLLKSKYKVYRAAKKPRYKQLKLIRDKLAAHRDPLGPRQIADLWQSIDTNDLLSVLKPIPPLFDVLKDLGIYEWTLSQTTDEGDIVAFVRPLVFQDNDG